VRPSVGRWVDFHLTALPYRAKGHTHHGNCLRNSVPSMKDPQWTRWCSEPRAQILLLNIWSYPSKPLQLVEKCLCMSEIILWQQNPEVQWLPNMYHNVPLYTVLAHINFLSPVISRLYTVFVSFFVCTYPGHGSLQNVIILTVPHYKLWSICNADCELFKRMYWCQNNLTFLRHWTINKSLHWRTYHLVRHWVLLKWT
jgi:hypothetical protein